MAGRGKAPGDPEKRVGHHKPETMTELDQAAAPTKARALPGSKQRHPRTRRWWKTAATSAQAALFMETDWLVMERLADLYDAFFGGATTVASEIRLCEAKLGFTAEDRLRLRWRLADNLAADERAEKQAEPGGRAKRADPRLKLVRGRSA